jgi:transcriptional regulator with XRE-family HTH domain
VLENDILRTLLKDRVMKNRLREIREKQGKTLKEAGKATGLSHVQVIRHETGEQGFSIETLLDYCSLYKVGIDEIVDVPLKGKKSAKLDEMRMDMAIGYIVEACDAEKVNAGPKQVGKWATYLYNESVDLHFTPSQMKGLAYVIVRKEGKRG